MREQAPATPERAITADSPRSPSDRLVHLTRAFIGVASVAIGVVLFIGHLSVQQLALLIGVGIALAGVALVVRAPTSTPSTPSTPNAPNAPSALLTVRLIGALLIGAGVLMAAWPESGAPWLAMLIAAAIIAHGIGSAVSAIRGTADHRTATLLAAVAAIIAGSLALSWPVLTLSLFRLAIGGWLLFTGMRILFDLWHRRRPRHPRAHPPRTRTRERILTWSRTVAAGLALVLAAGAAYGSAQLLGGTPQPVPGAFYTAPDQVPETAGQLIRSEPLTTGVPAGAEGWRILYTTTHPDGSPAVSSGTILAPAERGDDPLPLLTVSHGTTGVVDGCSPSLSQTPFADGAGTAMAEMVVTHGWAAVTSDYIGLGTAGTHPYLVGEAEARNVLDASLAVQQFSEFDFTTDTVIWGHSQGGQGSLWTGQIATSYAPSLNVLGVAAFAPAADLFGLAEADKDTAPGKTVSAYIAQTWNQLYPELQLESHLTPGSADPVERISQLCFNGNDALAAILRGSQVPNQIFPDSLLAGEFGDRLRAQTPTGPWPAPVLVAQGLTDPLVLPPMQQQWVDDRCDDGTPIDYRTFEGLSHVSLVAADSPLTPQLVEWTLDRWSGQPAPHTCTSKTYPKTTS